MADRYWVGGTASWDGTAGTKWATTSGGTGGASVPTAADDVFFTNLSTGTCTIAAGNTGAKSINCTGFTGTLAGTAAITVSGSVTISTGMVFSYSGGLTLAGTGTLTSSGKTFSCPITISGSGITVTLGDALTVNSGGNFLVSLGTFSTANYNLTLTGSTIFNSSAVGNVRTINLGSSTISIATGGSAISFAFNSGLTFNAGTSTIILSGTSSQITGGAASGGTGVTFNNVQFTATSTGTHNIVSRNTFNNLSVTAPSSAGVTQLTFDSNQTINGTLSTTGTAGNRRVWFRSSTYGVRQTLTINSAPSLTDADFRDIIVTGTAAPISGTRIGNLRGNSGITFDAPKTVYWNLAGAQNWSANGWASTSTGTPSTDNFPLAQDTATFTNAGSVTGTITMDTAIPYTGTVDMSGRTSAMTLSLGGSLTCYGDWINGTGTTISTANPLTFSGRNTQTITSAGKTFPSSITIDSYGGTVQLADAVNTGSSGIVITNGTFDTKNYNVTAGSLSSNNSNVRFIKLGSSTVTLSSSGSIIGIGTITNLTFDAGTSTIVGSSNGAITSGGLVFYNVSLTSTSAADISISGINTYNNISVTAPSSAGLKSITLFANQIVTGTLTVAGASAVRRIFLRSDTIGTTRTITANAISADDCDFRDITIAGSAAGASPTRVGDCGGNSGINFPAPKTVYWNLSGTQSWSATGWATSSGGTPALNNFPLAQDTAVFDDVGAVGTVQSQAFNIGTIDASARTSAMTLSYNVAYSIYGNYTLGSGVTVSGTNTVTFSGRGTQTFTSAGKTITFPITVDSFSGTFQLGDALNSSNSLLLTSGTFDAVSYNVTSTSVVSAAGSTLKMGSGLWTLTGTATLWSMNLATNLFKGTADILLSNTTTTARTFGGANLSYNKLTIGGTTGTSTLTISGNNQFTELASTKTVAHTIDLGTTNQTFGKWTVTGSAGNVVTLSGTGTSHILAGSCTSGIDYLAMGSIGFAAASPAEFYAGANSTGTATAPVYRTATPAARTLYWVGGTGNWGDTAKWSTSSGGSGGASLPTTLDDVVFDSASNATAYTATVTGTTARCQSLTIAPPATGNITLAGSTTLFIHGNVTLPATGLTRTYTGAITLSGSTTGKTFTTNGVTIGGSITINGVGCGWSLGSSFSDGGSGITITVTNGSFNTSGYTVTTGAFSSNNTNTRSLILGSSTITVQGLNAFASSVNLTFDAGTSNISCTNSAVTFNGGGQTFYNLSFTSTAIGTQSILGANTFNNLTVAGRTSAGIAEIALSANQIINGTLTLSAGVIATCRTFVRSDTIGTTRTLTCNAIASLTDIDFRDITIAGSAAPVSGTRLGDCKGNSGITFDAPKTVYWQQASSSNWGASGSGSWAASNPGTPAQVNFPLAQDTAIFPSNFPNSGSTVTINANYNIGTIDMSARTSNTMTLATSSNTPTIYGNWINGTGTTLSGTGTLTFAGRGSQTITSAGKTFTQVITIDSLGGSVSLQDSCVASNLNGFRVNSGTFDANNYNLTVSNGSGSFVSTGSVARTIAIGSGTWTIAGSSTSWNTSGSNLTVTGTGIISLTSASAKTFAGGGISYSGITLDQGGAGALTITGNNTFANITNTYGSTGATTIALGTTTQRVANFTATGTVGKVLTITGNTSNLIYTGGSNITGLDYLNVQGRVYGSAGQMTDVWYAGANSVNSGSLGWIFADGVAPPVSANANFFLMFA